MKQRKENKKQGDIKMKTIIFDENGIVYGTGENKKSAFNDMKQRLDREIADSLTIDDIEANYRNLNQAPAGKYVYNKCTGALYNKIMNNGGDCGFDINENGIADLEAE